MGLGGRPRASRAWRRGGTAAEAGQRGGDTWRRTRRADVSVGGAFFRRRRVEMDLSLGTEGIRDILEGEGIYRHRGS